MLVYFEEPFLKCLREQEFLLLRGESYDDVSLVYRPYRSFTECYVYYLVTYLHIVPVIELFRPLFCLGNLLALI